jgi:hypothetical protein
MNDYIFSKQNVQKGGGFYTALACLKALDETE